MATANTGDLVLGRKEPGREDLRRLLISVNFLQNVPEHFSVFVVIAEIGLENVATEFGLHQTLQVLVQVRTFSELDISPTGPSREILNFFSLAALLISSTTLGANLSMTANFWFPCFSKSCTSCCSLDIFWVPAPTPSPEVLG